jgi:hypothetical protein
LLAQSDIDVQSVERRTKSLASIVEKAGRPGKRYSAPLEEISDLSGLRVICYHVEDIERICVIFHANFAVHEDTGGQSEELSFDRFGYVSRHLVVSVSPERAKLPEWTVGDFQKMVEIKDEALHLMLKEVRGRESRSWMVSRDFAALLALLRSHRDAFSTAELAAHGFSEEAAGNVLD